MAYDCADSLTKKNLIDYVHRNRKLNSMRIDTLGTFKYILTAIALYLHYIRITLLNVKREMKNP